MRLLLAHLAVTVAVLAVPAHAVARPLAPAKIVAKLNVERARLGMGAVALQPDWSAKCALHNRWMQLNHVVQHPEIRRSRGYTEDGNWAGTHSVLARSAGWRHGDPWANAPIHLSQIHHPYLTTAGASDRYGHNCLTTWPGVDPRGPVAPPAAPITDHVFTDPPDGGRAAYAQWAMESPFTPQQKVGIPAARVTGPYLYVWSATDTYDDAGAEPTWDPVTEEFVQPDWYVNAPAPLQRLVAGSLVSAGGAAVPVKVIDDRDVGGYVGSGNGWLLPTWRLKPGTTYRATVVLATDADTDPSQARQVTHTWSFRATGATLGYVPTRHRRR